MNINKQLVTTFDGMSVYLVDGSKLRKAVTRQQVDTPDFKHFDDFLDYGIHNEFPQIPEGEVWIANELREEERAIVAIVATYELELLKEGRKADEAWDMSNAMNITLRHELQTSDVVVKKPYKTVDGINVWVVDGFIVRNTYDPNFIQGGNPQVYSFIPVNDIWLDNTLEPDELEPVMIHELTELKAMQGGMDYDHAHAIAEDAEYTYREKHT